MLTKYLSEYDSFKENLPHRYLPPSVVDQIIHQQQYAYNIIGHSFLGKPIYLLSIGTGNRKLLFWAQMHGNESTAARAMFDFWKMMRLADDEFKKKILSNFQIDFIPQLNPDGAEVYTRRNAANIDLNRDYLSESSSEIQALKYQVNLEQYEFLFNLHDQRTIFHPENSNLPATLSFLAPSVSPKNELTENRKQSMQLIAQVFKGLKPLIPNQLARFTHEFYPTSCGDNFQKAGFATVLIECGHFPHDYARNQTRKYTFYTYLLIFKALLNNDFNTEDLAIYEAIPMNQDKALDMIIKNVLIQKNNSETVVDLGIQFEEQWNPVESEISLLAKIKEIGDLSLYLGHYVLDAAERVFSRENSKIPKIGDTADFNLSEWTMVNGILNYQEN